MLKILLFAFILLFSSQIKAQNIRVTFKVQETNGKKLNKASVTLQNNEDSTNFYYLITDSFGVASINLENKSQWKITTTSQGFKANNKTFLVTENQKALVIILGRNVKQLDDVVVKSKKPLITQEDDKAIVDPENLIPSSTNGFEVLEKIPGIFTDQDGNFYLTSTTPSTIQINGREIKMGANDLATLLKSLPPNSILKVEILRTPSAKNDASGSGGIINIILRKGVKLGFTGSAYAGANLGKFSNQFAGISLSNNDDKKTTYANIGFQNRATYDELNSDRILSIDSNLYQNSYSKILGFSPNASYGISYMPNKNWDLAYDGNISFNKADNNATNINDIKNITTNNKFVSNKNNVINDGNTINFGQTLSAKLKKDSGKIEWNNIVSYSFFNYNNDQNYTTNFNLPTTFTTIGNGEQNSKRHYITAQTDLTYKPIKKLTFEAGLKTAFINFKNTTNFFKNNLPDVFRSNEFKYTENISALYLQVAKTVEKFVLKTGVRLEHTNMQGNQIIPNNQKFSIKRTDAFPYAYLSRPIIRIMGYDLKGYLVYRKGISRPGYDLLNPFPKFIDNYLSEVGNPNLKPQFTDQVEANISFEDQPVFAIGKTITKGIFTNVIYQRPGTNETLRTFDNLGKNTENYIRFTGALPPGGKYFFVIGGQINMSHYEGLYDNKPLDFKNTSRSFFTYHELKLGKLSTLTMNGFLQTGGLFQFYELSNFGQLNFSINRKFFNKKITVTANMRDIFYTNNNEFSISQGTIKATGKRQSDTRRFGLSVRYNFGIKKKENEAPVIPSNENVSAGSTN